jgi:hypothetical protein
MHFGRLNRRLIVFVFHRELSACDRSQLAHAKHCAASLPFQCFVTMRARG